jgi:hypothetical protein
VKLRAIPWAAVDRSLTLMRLPFDAATRMVPDRGTGLRLAAKAAVDGADSGIRAIASMILGDPPSVDDSTAQRPGGDREAWRHGRGDGSGKLRARDPKERQGRARAKPGRTPQKAAPAAQQAVRAEGPRASVTPAARPAPRAAPRQSPATSGAGRAAAISGTVGRSASGSRARGSDLVVARNHPPPASRGKVVEPSHEEIATRAYDLYQRGVPGDAHTHWEAARRELTSKPQ